LFFLFDLFFLLASLSLDFERFPSLLLLADVVVFLPRLLLTIIPPPLSLDLDRTTVFFFFFFPCESFFLFPAAAIAGAAAASEPEAVGLGSPAAVTVAFFGRFRFLAFVGAKLSASLNFCRVSLRADFFWTGDCESCSDSDEDESSSEEESSSSSLESSSSSSPLPPPMRIETAFIRTLASTKYIIDGN
jgi:hypothetical protein